MNKYDSFQIVAKEVPRYGLSGKIYQWGLAPVIGDDGDEGEGKEDGG